MSTEPLSTIGPYTHSFLEVSGGHRLYYEECGDPRGPPVLFVHGGPGSGCNSHHRQFFSALPCRAILFDQRGCGRSTPLGRTQENATSLLVEDMERLRLRLQIPRWLLFGGSWGAALSLAYAERFADAVAGLVLRGVFLGGKAEVNWYLYGLKRFVPEAWEALAAPARKRENADLLGFYYRQIRDGEQDAPLAAAQCWNNYETAVMALGEASSPASASASAEAILSKAKIQTHYLAHHCFLAEGELLDRLAVIRGIPAIIVQGRLDMVCPPGTAYTLHRAWPGSRLKMVEGAGHSAMNPLMAQTLVSALREIIEMVASSRKRS